MKLAVLTTGYPRYEGDVAGNFVEGMVDALRRRGHRVEVFAPDSETHGGADVHWVQYLPKRMQRTFYGRGAPDNLRDPRTWLGALSFPVALRLAVRERFDAVISHFGVPCGVVGATLGIPQLVVWHSADVHLARHIPFRRRLFGRSQHWFVQHEHPRQLGLEGVVCPMGANVERMDRHEARTKWNIHGKTVLYVGRNVAIKGLDVLLAAARDASWSLIATCEGASSSAVRFVGPVTARQRDELLAACDALAIPSRESTSGRTEGSPVVAQEGLLAGIPIVASAVGGLRSIPATLVAPDNVDALRTALDEAVQQPHGHTGGSTWPDVAAKVEHQLQLLL